MLARTVLSRAVRPVMPLASVRCYSGEGATGSGFSRAGGQAAGDSFTKREKAAEDLYIRQHEQEKLKALKAKIQAQKAHLQELENHVDEMSRTSGGEKN